MRNRRRSKARNSIPDKGSRSAIIKHPWGSRDATDEPRISKVNAEPPYMKNQPNQQSQPSTQPRMQSTSQTVAAAPIPVTRIEQARINAGFTREQAAKKARLSVSTIRQIERCTHPLSLLTLTKLQACYGCPTSYLLSSRRAVRKGRPAATLKVHGKASKVAA